MSNVINLYQLRQNGKIITVGTLTMVWTITKQVVGNITGEQFKALGYEIVSARRAA